SRIGPNWFAVPYGAADELTMYLPIDYIETVTNKRVVLSQPAGLLIDMKLDRSPAEFPDERVEMSGIPHDPRRGEPGQPTPVPEPIDTPAQQESPPAAGSRDVVSAAGGQAPGAVPNLGHSAVMRS